jgi:GLPGLI family protein
MMTNKLLILITWLLCCQAQGQAVISQGKIKYECKMNMHRKLDKFSQNNEWVEGLRKRMPKYYLANFDLYFNVTESYYTKSKEQPEQDDKAFSWFKPENDANVVYKNLDSNILIMSKSLFETKMLLQDSLPTATWKITNEYRKIANYNCRKATTIIMDSLYIIAYYTDAITTTSGPETVNGLPGMILGVVVPRLHTNIFATSVEANTNITDKIVKPTKGTAMNFKKAEEMISKIGKNWSDNNKEDKLMIWGYLW